MDEYMKEYDTYQHKIVYCFHVGCGGIGDCIKYFIYLLKFCMQYKYRLYYLINDIDIEKYLKLRYDIMYIQKSDIKILNYIKHEGGLEHIRTMNPAVYYMAGPMIFYDKSHYTFTYDTIHMKIDDVFTFHEDVLVNSRILLGHDVSDYISLHVRLGDQYLETDSQYVFCKTDSRKYDEKALCKYIEDNRDKTILFFCDNHAYKLKIKQMYNNIIILNSKIGHTGLLNTTHKQTLDTITEFYIMTKSSQVVIGSDSGFPIIASKFHNVPLIEL